MLKEIIGNRTGNLFWNKPWKDERGLKATWYENGDMDTLDIPSKYCMVIAYIPKTDRGVAIAIQWANNTPVMWVNNWHYATGWGGWKKFFNGVDIDS